MREEEIEHGRIQKEPLCVYLVNIKQEFSYQDMRIYFDILDKKKQERIKKFYYMEDAKRTFCADLLARFMLAKRTGMNPSDVKFRYNKYGKPYMKECNNLSFNLSHSGNYVMGAIDEATIGVDIEKVKEIDLKIAERFFTKKETEYILKNNRIARFYEVWTKKESFVKAVGLGLQIPFGSFHVLEGDIEYDGEEYIVQSIPVETDYKAAICTQKRKGGVKLISFELDLFLQEFQKECEKKQEKII